MNDVFRECVNGEGPCRCPEAQAPRAPGADPPGRAPGRCRRRCRGRDRPSVVTFARSGRAPDASSREFGLMVMETVDGARPEPNAVGLPPRRPVVPCGSAPARDPAAWSPNPACDDGRRPIGSRRSARPSAPSSGPHGLPVGGEARSGGRRSFAPRGTALDRGAAPRCSRHGAGPWSRHRRGAGGPRRRPRRGSLRPPADAARLGRRSRPPRSPGHGGRTWHLRPSAAGAGGRLGSGPAGSDGRMGRGRRGGPRSSLGPRIADRRIGARHAAHPRGARVTWHSPRWCAAGRRGSPRGRGARGTRRP